MGYRYIFRPDVLSVARSDEANGHSDHNVYVFDDEAVILAVNVALATTRPLLVRGAPGSGKSTLAPNIARVMQRRYLELVVTSRTEPEDLLWGYDAVRRLSDAHHGQAERLESYYRPGVLWEAFESNETAVVLIDEIDKADPDLPNSLLAALGTYSFSAPDGRAVAAPKGAEPLVVITSNDERHLPHPFLRRCVALTLQQPSRQHLLQVARAHFGSAHDPELSRDVADLVLAARDRPATAAGPLPSTAEFLDTLRACQGLGIDTTSPEWEQLAEASLFKSANNSA